MASVDWNAVLTQYLALGPATDAATGGLLAQLGDAVQSAIEQTIGRTFDVRQYTEVYDGNGKKALYLRHDPIVSVSALSIAGQSVTVGDYFAPTYPPAMAVINATQTAVVFSSDYAYFPLSSASVLVTYKAGLAGQDGMSVPPALITAGCYWAGMLFKDRDRLGLSSANKMEQTISYTRTVPPAVLQMIASWKRGMKPTV